MVAFITIVIIVFLMFAEGIVYVFFSDLTDFFIPIFYNGALSSYTTTESINTFDMLMAFAKFCIMAFLIYIAFFIWQMSQKPEKEGWP